MPDYTVGDTVYKRFTTRAFATGAPTTLAGTPVVSAYEDDSVTQITAGITLGVDHDSVTGLNLLTIVATGANGFETGKSYDLVITTGTVDSVSVVGEVVWHFTLSAEAAAVDLANGTDGLGAIKAETAAILDDTDLIDDGTSGLAKIATDVAAVLVDTNELQGDWANGGRLDLILDARASQASVDTVDGIVDDILVDTAVIGAAGAGLTEAGGTGDHLTALATAAALTTVDGNVDAILLDTAEIGAAGAGLTDLGGMSTGMKAEVNAEVNDVINTDATTEPTGVPSATASLGTKIGVVHMMARNKVTVTSTKKTFHDDAGNAEFEKDLADDATTYSESEANAI